jgi:hypothetical protein
MFELVLVLLIIVGTTVWVGIDSHAHQVTSGGKDYVWWRNGALTWVVFCLLLWIVGFPLYLVKRSKQLRERAAVVNQVPTESAVTHMATAAIRKDRKYQSDVQLPEKPWDYTYEVNLAGGHVGGPEGDRQAAIMALSPGQRLDLKPEPDNPHDHNAVAVYTNGVQIGYVPAFKAEMVSDYLKAGRTVEAKVVDIETYEDRRGRELWGVRMWLGFRR